MDMTDKIKKTEVLEKHIVGENEISYTLGEDGLYYPDLRLPEGTHYEIGRYGRMRAEYLKEHHRALYLELLLSGEFNTSVFLILSVISINLLYLLILFW
jgi:hypothetical protein